MASTPLKAAQAIQKFRLHEFAGLKAHVKRFGPIDGVAAGRTNNLPNPFLPKLNPKTGRWAPPKYSLRRQAELVKKAKESNLLHLLPPGPKLARPTLAAENVQTSVPQVDSAILSALPKGAWSKPVNWTGELKAKPKVGADLGVRLYAGKKRMFKGHKWERVAKEREQKRKILMRDMAKRVASYKSYYHRRKPNPLKPARSAKAAKLPF